MWSLRQRLLHVIEIAITYKCWSYWFKHLKWGVKRKSLCWGEVWTCKYPPPPLHFIYTPSLKMRVCLFILTCWPILYAINVLQTKSRGFFLIKADYPLNLIDSQQILNQKGNWLQANLTILNLNNSKSSLRQIISVSVGITSAILKLIKS